MIDVIVSGSASLLGISAGREIFADQVMSAALTLAERLRVLDGSRIGVFVDCPVRLVAVLVALQMAEKQAVLLPHVKPRFLQTVAAGLSGIVSDLQLQTDVPWLPFGGFDIPEQPEPGHADLRCAWTLPVGFLTSGSSGPPREIIRTFDELQAEVLLLENRFGAAAGQRMVHGSVAHQHMFGFTFRLLWPLLTGRPIRSRQIRGTGEFGASLAADNGSIVVSSPAFLSKMTGVARGPDAGEVLIFSAGAPLDEAVAVHFNRMPGVRLIEIYGSTETGALASRRVTREGTVGGWSCFPGIEPRLVAGALQIRATHLAGGDWLNTGDRAERCADGTFDLRGRADRVVKVGDKRVGLDDIEQVLSQEPAVAAARVVQLSPRVLGAAVALTQEGWRCLSGSGRNALIRRLRRLVSDLVDDVAVPRKWRFLSRLPVDSQGKTAAETLTRLFSRERTDPRWEVLEQQRDSWVAAAVIDESLTVLQGHFPGAPIVPGVAQIDWVVTLIRRAFPEVRVTGELEAIKFRRPLLPGDRIRLGLCLRADACRVGFEIRDATALISSGRIVVELV